MRAAVIAAVLLSPTLAVAQERVTVRPRVELSEVSDNNLNDSPTAPVADQIHRLTSSLLMNYRSPRCGVRSTLSVDSERYRTHSALDDNRARSRALLGVACEATPRMTLNIDGSYLDTNTLEDLNPDTRIASGRGHGTLWSGGGAMRYRVSPRTSVTASASMLDTGFVRGIATSVRQETLAIERRTSTHDVARIEYQHADGTFENETVQTVRSHVLLAGWTREITRATSWTLRVGPRLTDGMSSVDAFASINHAWRSSAIAFSASRTQTTAVGYSGAVDAETAEIKYSVSPARRLLAYAAPAWFRNSRDAYIGTVYRIGAGLEWEVTPLVRLHVFYSTNRQQGGIDPFYAGAEMSRSTLALGLTCGGGQTR